MNFQHWLFQQNKSGTTFGVCRQKSIGNYLMCFTSFSYCGEKVKNECKDVNNNLPI